MDVLQGRYLKEITSKSGQIKGIKLETEDGLQTIYLPKPLREIAAKELALGDTVRVWSTSPNKGKKAKSGKKANAKKRYATGLIPLSPQVKLSLKEDEKSKQIKSKKKLKQSKPEKVKSKKDKSKKARSKKAKPMTVQLCQKKNCCKKGGTALWQQFEAASQETTFKLEAVGCLGGCKRGPNIRFLPKNVKHYHVQPEEIVGLLAKYQA